MKQAAFAVVAVAAAIIVALLISPWSGEDRPSRAVAPAGPRVESVRCPTPAPSEKGWETVAESECKRITIPVYDPRAPALEALLPDRGTSESRRPD